MPRISIMGAGSSVFAKNVLGDCILTPEIGALDISLHDIDPKRLEESRMMVSNIIANSGRTDITLSATLNRRESLKGAKYIINTIQVGLYDPCTITDFEVPKKYGLRQTIGDTLGIGGIFRGLRTINVLKDFAADIEEICPDALFINYTNPMSILTGYMTRFTKVKTIGLCHSVQGCAKGLLHAVGMDEYIDKCKWDIAGINHLAWLTSITDLEGNDLYPEIKRRAKLPETYETRKNDLVRLDIMDRFGYYITESSEHNAEYNMWYIKEKYPELIEKYNIPIDEYPRRCVNQIASWESMKKDLVENKALTHERTHEFASYIIRAMETDEAYRVHGNVLNNGLIPNLPAEAIVEVPCLIDRNGVNPCYWGNLPEQCAAIDRMHVSVHLLTILAATTLKKEYIYMAAMMDPHTASELSPDEIRAMCDDLIAEHGSWLPEYK